MCPKTGKILVVRIKMKNKNTFLNFKVCLLVCLVLFCVKVSAQTQSDSLYIALKAQKQKEGVALRWAVSNSQLWKQTNQTGFLIERYTIRRNGQLLDNPEKIVLEKSLKSLPLNDWETEAKKNAYAAVVAQALYGESMNVDNYSNNAMQTLVNAQLEQEQRFAFALYAADLDFKVAQMAGWGYFDKSIKNEEDYLYRVYASDSSLNLSYAYVYVLHDDFYKPQKPINFEAKFDDKKVLLSWDTHFMKNEYVAYQIEKSEDNKIFKPLSKTLIVNTTGSERIVIPDSLDENHKRYYYRMYGLNVFGDKSAYSDTISGEGYKPLSENPVFTKQFTDNEGVLHLEWSFDATNQDPIERFEIRRAESDKGEYKTVVNNIGANSRTAEIRNLLPTNYFVVAAIPQRGEERVSFPIFVQPVDSIPPAQPRGLKGSIDSLGVVRLMWERNTDADIYGYRVFRSLYRDGKLFKLNDVAIKNPFFADTIGVYDLNTKVYYAVAALDMRYNQSQLSDTIELRKPDFIPPSSPVLKSYTSGTEGITLYWVTSTSDDAKSTCVYRVEKGKTDTALVREVPISYDKWTDKSPLAGKTLVYFLRAKDESGLFSSSTPSINVVSKVAESTSIKIKVSHLPQGRLMTWEINGSTPKRIEIYRKKDSEEDFLYWKTLSGSDTSVADKEQQTGQEYSYYFKLIIEGSAPIFSEVVR